MSIKDLVSFHKERFFEGAVQLRWSLERRSLAEKAAAAFVFHGPRYHAAAAAEQEGIEGGYRLKDSASFVRDLLASFGLETANPYWLVVAGYGSGKSHLALTCAELLGDPLSERARSIIEHIGEADADLAADVATELQRLQRPVLVLPLDGMSGFHLGNGLSQVVFAQLNRYGVDAAAIRALSPRFETATQFVERNWELRRDRFRHHLPNTTEATLLERLHHHDEAAYDAVDAIYTEANGVPIPVTGQESAQELLTTLSSHYCGEAGPFSGVLVLFDEFGRYLEYAAEKPHLAGDAALQQIFEGVQNSGAKVRFVGFIQYELKAYLKRFSSTGLRQLQRYITRFDAAEKWYLSTNLETIFAHMIGKRERALNTALKEANATVLWQESWSVLQQMVPASSRLPVWSDRERFSTVIGRGCWPLHPLATWFLTRQRDVVQSRSALTFIHALLEQIADEEVVQQGRLRQISAAELVLQHLLAELVAAERESGGTLAETLHLLLEKFQAHLTAAQRQVLAGVAIMEKMRIGRQPQPQVDRLLCEVTALPASTVQEALTVLSSELGALEWNRDLGLYELIADASTRGQFQQWLRKRHGSLTPDRIAHLFKQLAPTEGALSSITTDFAQSRSISTLDWGFEAHFIDTTQIAKALPAAFEAWQKATGPADLKGQILYLYLPSECDRSAITAQIEAELQQSLQRLQQPAAPIWVVGLDDRQGAIAEALARLHLLRDQISSEDRERFRRFVTDETDRSREALQQALQQAVRERNYWVAGVESVAGERLKSSAEAIFAAVYPQTIPFIFDGFNTTNGGGAADAMALTLALVAQQVDGVWLQAQPKRMQNRATQLLQKQWRVFSPQGVLGDPTAPAVAPLYQQLLQAHQQQPERLLADSYRQMLAPPYGMNSASAALLLALLLALQTPSRRVIYKGQMVALVDWRTTAFPMQRNRQQLDPAVLEQSQLRLLSEDGESRWRTLLKQWDGELNLERQVALLQEAERLERIDPRPEVLEGRYCYLRDAAHKAREQLQLVKSELEEIERSVERAERQNSVDHLLRAARQLLRKREQLSDDTLWPTALLQNSEVTLAMVRQMLSPLLNEWTLRQSCHNAQMVNEFRERITKAVKTLHDLGFAHEAQVLQNQSNQLILRVEDRQRFNMTLNQCEEYPRQPPPNESSLIRDLRDDRQRGDSLIEMLKQANGVLKPEEIQAHNKAIQQRQQALSAMIQRQEQRLGAIYSQSFESETELQEALVQARRLQILFVDTNSAREINELVMQLQRVLSDIAAWPSDETTPERLEEQLQQQIATQLAELESFWAAEEIDPAWSMETIYSVLMAQRLERIRKRAHDWIIAKRIPAPALARFDRRTLLERLHELEALPYYLSRNELQEVEQLREMLQQQLQQLEERERQQKLTSWQQPFLTLAAMETLDRVATERLLQTLEQPPVELRPEERALLAPIAAALRSHLDQFSLNEMMERIQRLSQPDQQNLLQFLQTLLKTKNAST